LLRRLGRLHTSGLRVDHLPGQVRDRDELTIGPDSQLVLTGAILPLDILIGELRIESRLPRQLAWHTGLEPSRRESVLRLRCGRLTWELLHWERLPLSGWWLCRREWLPREWLSREWLPRELLSRRKLSLKLRIELRIGLSSVGLPAW